MGALTCGSLGEFFGGLVGLIFHQKSGECHEIQRKKNSNKKMH